MELHNDGKQSPIILPGEEEKEVEAPMNILTPKDTESDSSRETGQVKWFNDARSYGFIEREGKEDVFVHESNVNHEPPTLNENDLVEFELVSTDKGLSAENVTVIAEAV